MNCPNCDHSLGPQAKFCANCGLPLGSDRTVADRSAALFSDDGWASEERRPMLIGGVAAAAILLLGLIWWAAAARQSRRTETPPLNQFAQYTPQTYSPPAGYAPTYTAPAYTPPTPVYQAPRPRRRRRPQPVFFYPPPVEYAPRMSLAASAYRPDYFAAKSVGVRAFAGQAIPAVIPAFDPNLEAPDAREWMNHLGENQAAGESVAPGYYNSGGFRIPTGGAPIPGSSR